MATSWRGSIGSDEHDLQDEYISFSSCFISLINAEAFGLDRFFETAALTFVAFEIRLTGARGFCFVVGIVGIV